MTARPHIRTAPLGIKSDCLASLSYRNVRPSHRVLADRPMIADPRKAPVLRLSERGLRVGSLERLEMAQDQRDLRNDRVHAGDFPIDPFLFAEPVMRRLPGDEAGTSRYAQGADN